ncbi:hypothetical protein [Sinomonas sp. P47F7]|uniref:hypothetical protein n=2 Tax=unclassified Sinomonas TaxID=2646595 RepID=UPI003BF5BFEE
MIARHRIVLSAAAACLAAAAVAGCAQSPSDFDSSVAASLQAATEKVRTDAAAGHYASALQELQNIESQANDAATQGKLSAARKQDVLAALALVRVDLQALMGSRSTPSATPSTPGTPTKSKKKEKSPEPSPTQDSDEG